MGIVEQTNDIPRSSLLIKDRLLQEFPKEAVQGLNILRVENFIREAGLVVKPYIIFDQCEKNKVQEIIQQHGHSPLFLSFHSGGVYHKPLDMAFVARHREYETAFGEIFTEGILVHELAHASSMYRGYFAKGDRKFYNPRIGFSLQQYFDGKFLEEGWADMHRAQYRALYASQEEKEKLQKALNYGEISWEDVVPVCTPSGIVLPMPVKYLYCLYVHPNKVQLMFSAHAYAGYACELLCTMNPHLMPLMVEARQSVDGLRKLAQELDAMSPGLYCKLQLVDNLEDRLLYDSFSTKLSVVITDVVGGIRNVVRAEVPLGVTWSNFL